MVTAPRQPLELVAACRKLAEGGLQVSDQRIFTLALRGCGRCHLWQEQGLGVSMLEVSPVAFEVTFSETQNEGFHI